METGEFKSFFLPKLQEYGYEGIMESKSRHKTMTMKYKEYVDGCALFWLAAKWVATYRIYKPSLFFAFFQPVVAPVGLNLSLNPPIFK